MGVPRSPARVAPVAIWAYVASSVAPGNIGLGRGSTFLCSQTNFNVRDGDDVLWSHRRRVTCARGHRSQLRAVVSPSEGSCLQLLGRVAFRYNNPRPPTSFRSWSWSWSVSCSWSWSVAGSRCGSGPVFGAWSRSGTSLGVSVNLYLTVGCRRCSRGAGVAGARSIACGSCSRRRPPLWRCQSCSARSTGGRSPTSSLVRLSATPWSTPVTALIGMATLFLPHKCPSSRRTWVT